MRNPEREGRVGAKHATAACTAPVRARRRASGERPAPFVPGECLLAEGATLVGQFLVGRHVAVRAGLGDARAGAVAAVPPPAAI